MATVNTQTRRDICIPLILKEEGGFTKNPKDTGNWTGGKIGSGTLLGTKYGIAAHANPGVDIPNLTVAQAVTIYAKKYWAPAGCDLLPVGVDLSVFDPAVNMGVSRGKTLASSTATLAPQPRIKAIAAKRRALYASFRDYKLWSKGWLARTARIEALSLSMAMGEAGMPTKVVVDKLKDEAKTSNTKVTQTGTGAAAVTTAPAAGVLSAPEAFNWPALILGGVLVAVLLALAIHLIRAQWERSKAMEEIADGLL